MVWKPTEITRFIKSQRTSTNVLVVDTDMGIGYLKALGNPVGPHALACELVGTRLAQRMGLQTLDLALIRITQDEEYPFANGEKAQPGPAIITRAETGSTWGGGPGQLKMVENAEDFAKLVVFDTWTRNCDRFYPDRTVRRPNRDNVFLSTDGAPKGKFILKAIDHTHCFDRRPELTSRISAINNIKDTRIYGLFPEFHPYVKRSLVAAFLQELKRLSLKEINGIIKEIPEEWSVDSCAKAALGEFLFRRIDFLSEEMGNKIPPQGEFHFMEDAP